MKSIQQDGFFTDESLEGIPLHYKQYTMAGITLGQSSVAGFEIFAFTPHTHTHTHTHTHMRLEQVCQLGVSKRG